MNDINPGEPEAAALCDSRVPYWFGVFGFLRFSKNTKFLHLVFFIITNTAVTPCSDSLRKIKFLRELVLYNKDQALENSKFCTDLKPGVKQCQKSIGSVVKILRVVTGSKHSAQNGFTPTDPVLRQPNT